MIKEYEHQQLKVCKTIYGFLQGMTKTPYTFQTADREVIVKLVDYLKEAGFMTALNKKYDNGGQMIFVRNSFSHSCRARQSIGVGVSCTDGKYEVRYKVTDGYLKTTSRPYDEEAASRLGWVYDYVNDPRRPIR